jgi:N-(2-amino-2-carboxyethyl)-L-glutamate synthase
LAAFPDVPFLACRSRSLCEQELALAGIDYTWLLDPVISAHGVTIMSILQAVGNTPLVLLERSFSHDAFQVWAKLELLNPGGSAKDRPAVAMIDAAIATGEIGPGTVVVESSSGNMGIGLAQACRCHQLRFVCVIDPKTSPLNIKILQAYGAEVELVAAPDPVSSEFLPARIARVQALLREIPNSFWPNQYGNQVNAAAHYRTTMRELDTTLAGGLDFLFVATSTCGTLRGCAEYVRDRGLATWLVAVDAVGSSIFASRPARRLIPGMGAAVRPALCETGLADRIVHVSDLESIVSCRRLVREEGILAGGSSGGVLAAIRRCRREIPAGSSCVAILPDRGERYLDTIYDDNWVQSHFGDALDLERLLVHEAEEELATHGQP